MSKFTNLIRGIETVEGEVVDEHPRSPKLDVNVTHNHVGKIKVGGTHAAVGRIVSERYAQKIAHEQRMRDARSSALIQGAGIFAAIRAAFKSIEKPKEEVSFGMSESSGGSGGEASVDHSCTDHGDWGDYGAW